MSYPAAAADPVVQPVAAHERAAALDPCRKLQLALGAIWLLDAMLQFQPFMFGRGFAQMLAAGAHGNPAIAGRPVAWSAAFIGHHVIVLNAIFAAIQLLLGLGIAWRPTARLALAASVPWALAVWWFGEGLGGLLAGTASPVNGAPGAVLLYGLLAVLLWPAVLAAIALLPSIPLTPPARPARAAVILALAVAAALWLAGGLGGVLTGSATDPGTGPLLALLALAFWPAAGAAAPAAASPGIA